MSTAVAIQPEDTFVAHVASEVRGLTAKFRMTQAELSALLHLSQGAVSNRMRGAQAFQLHEIEIIARYFDTTPAVVMGYANEPAPRRPARPTKYTARDSNPEPAD